MFIMFTGQFPGGKGRVLVELILLVRGFDGSTSQVACNTASLTSHASSKSF